MWRAKPHAPHHGAQCTHSASHRLQLADALTHSTHTSLRAHIGRFNVIGNVCKVDHTERATKSTRDLTSNDAVLPALPRSMSPPLSNVPCIAANTRCGPSKHVPSGRTLGVHPCCWDTAAPARTNLPSDRKPPSSTTQPSPCRKRCHCGPHTAELLLKQPQHVTCLPDGGCKQPAPPE